MDRTGGRPSVTALVDGVSAVPGRQKLSRVFLTVEEMSLQGGEVTTVGHLAAKGQSSIFKPSGFHAT